MWKSLTSKGPGATPTRGPKPSLHQLAWFGLGGLALAGCEPAQETTGASFYQRNIDPIVRSGCSTSPSGSACHVTQDARENALGNLSFESFAALDKRRDLFEPYGPYAMPGLLLKALPPFQLALSNYASTEPTFITTDIAHAGGALLDPGSVSFAQLSRWIQRGGTENNVAAGNGREALTPCTSVVGEHPEFDPDTDPEAEDFEQFASEVSGTLGSRCGAGNCHGSPGNSMYLTCGEDARSRRWNYFVAADYISETPQSSEVLRRALSPSQGGSFHEGGTIFETPSDPGYEAILRWAEERGGPRRVPTEPGFGVFANRVQPMLVKKGCMQLGCHSATMGHDYRLRGGSAGHFSLPATRTNYELTLEQIALESPNPNASRILRKNLPPRTGGGITHRGGSLFAGSPDFAECDQDAALNGPLDEQPPYCVIAAWIAMEREERMPTDAGLTHIVYVSRPAGSRLPAPQDFERFVPGSRLVRAEAQLTQDGSLSLSGAEEDLLSLCGLDGTGYDVRRPAVSWDGTRLAFSVRSSESEPFRIYELVDSTCTVVPGIDRAPMDDQGNPVPSAGHLIHNFDPSYAPDGRLVFTSTRGNVMNTSAFDYSGPQRSPANPARLNANLYVLEGERIRQLTFLLDQELFPSFMRDGRLIFSTEKRAPGFYQLAGRRMNLDGGDYHPLYAQRPSVGHNQLTEIVELADRNLAGIFSQQGAQLGAGRLGIINRSVGIDQRSGAPQDYPQDPSVAGSLNEDFYQHAIVMLDLRATGQLDATQGAYVSPSPLPNGKLLVSHAANATQLRNIEGEFALLELDPVSGQRTPLLERPGEDLLWAAAVYARQPANVFRSRIDEPNGATTVYSNGERTGYSEVMYLDLPLLSSLLFQNTRSGRPFIDEVSAVEFWEQLPPEPSVTSFDEGGSFVVEDRYGQVYVRRRRLGRVTLQEDGSAKVRLPGGVPFNLAVRTQLDGDPEPTLHHQREANQFYPGEAARQSFPRELFDGVCGNCHGSVSGLESDVATNPDILTRASQVMARDLPAVDVLERSEVSPPPFP